MTISGWQLSRDICHCSQPVKGANTPPNGALRSASEEGVLPNMMQVMNAITPFMNQPRRSLTPASCASAIFIERDRLGAST
jgi:hypothetical protein